MNYSQPGYPAQPQQPQQQRVQFGVAKAWPKQQRYSDNSPHFTGRLEFTPQQAQDLIRYLQSAPPETDNRGNQIIRVDLSVWWSQPQGGGDHYLSGKLSQPVPRQAPPAFAPPAAPQQHQQPAPQQQHPMAPQQHPMTPQPPVGYPMQPAAPQQSEPMPF